MSTNDESSHCLSKWRGHHAPSSLYHLQLHDQRPYHHHDHHHTTLTSKTTTTTTSQINDRSSNSDTNDLKLIQSCQYHRDQVIRCMMTTSTTSTSTATGINGGINGVRDQSHLASFHFDQYLHYYDQIQQKQQKQSDTIQQYDRSNMMTDDGDTIQQHQHHQSLLLLLPHTTYEQLIDMYLHRFHNPIRAANVWHHITMNSLTFPQSFSSSDDDDDIMSQWINSLKDRIEQYTNHRYASMDDMHDGHALWYRPQLMSMAQYHHHHYYYYCEQLQQSDTHTLCADDGNDSVYGAATMTMTNRLKCKIEQVFDCIWQEQQRYNNPCDHHTLRMKFEESSASLTSSSSLSHRSIYTDAHIENQCVFYREKPLVYVDLNHLSSSLSSQDTSLKRLKRQVFQQFISIGDGTTSGKQGKVKHKRQHKGEKKNKKKRHVTVNGDNNDNDDIAEDSKNKIAIRFVFLIMKLLVQSLSHRTSISASSGGSSGSGKCHHHSIYDTYPLLSILEPSIIYQQQMGSGGDESDDGGQLEDMHTINELYRLMMNQLSLQLPSHLNNGDNGDTMVMDLGTFERLYLTMSNYCFGSVSTEQYFMGQIISLVNHSCAPNAKLVLVHNSDDPELTLVALRDIQPGEQITISYFGTQMDSESHSDGRSDDIHGRNIRQERRKSMAYHHGFTCAETCHCDPEVKQRMLLL